MPEKIEELVRKAVADAQEAGDLPYFEVGDLGLERPADADNGDWTTTLALRSARLAHMAPRAIAQAIVNHMEKDPGISKVEVAGPGFVNFYLSAAANNEVFRTVREQGHDFGRSNIGAGEKVQVEFVSANPVGPLHIGHGRWAALGDSLCRVMEHAGYNVEREYYINDHGSQMDVFGNSVAERYLQLAQVVSERGCSLDEAVQVLLDDRKAFVKDEEDAHPELHPYMDAFNKNLGGNAYGGDYIIDVARHFMETDGTRWVDSDPEERMLEFRERGYKLMLESIKSTLDESRCHFDVWFSERSLYEKGEDGTSAVDRALARLDEMGYLYRDEDGALWFRSTALGDDKDRVLIKTNGEYTYFASDVAYHWNKFQRVDHVIDIWGADHHGYIQRVDSACTALGYPGKLEVLLGQLVNLLRDGVPVRMSKRKGTMIPFKELMDEVGVDATRYTLISKSSNQMIDFDIEKVKKQDNTNPVYYVQYAHARICSILRKGAGVTAEEAEKLGMDEVARRAVGEEYDLSLLTDPTEATLARKLSEFPALVEGCARDRAPFRLTHYAEELAGDFHSFYTVCKVLPSKGRPVDEGLSKARLAAVDATRRVLALTLEFCGVHAPQSM
ncbi:arginine--tRNA ligase [Olsenella sp. AM30-3LB]|uniref:arginine--tRNA ligase n=1 Tax=Olsenella sp. AM30-3LB TaxID=2292359 RepID=UPI000E52D22A|nr:arginine--tRNA ligase [Olsenella sp. AM30-3LB]RHD72083.1 arginine--tRNA ligase [Olsenella sp. AM30-3LB]